MTDCFLYSGGIGYPFCFDFIELVEKTQESSDVAIVLSTNGGDADAAYKMGDYLQDKYENVGILIPGLCKSAGTILAIAANELVFSPCGELGPLDVQIRKKDSPYASESGLDIKEGIDKLQNRATNLFHAIMRDNLDGSSGTMTTFQTASDSAAKFVSSLFKPIFAHIDPKEIGDRARAMEVAKDYRMRLNWKSENFKLHESYVLKFLTEDCPSHGFVINMNEAAALFKNVRKTSKAEEYLIQKYRMPEKDEPIIKNLTERFQKIEVSESKPHSQKEVNGKSQTTTAAKETKAISQEGS